MKSLFTSNFSRRYLWLMFLAAASFGSAAYLLTNSSTAQDESTADRSQSANEIAKSDETPELIAFREKVGDLVQVIVELKDDPAAVRQYREKLNVRDNISAYDKISEYAVNLTKKQDEAIAGLNAQDVRMMMRVNNVRQIDGSVRRIEYRFTYLLNGFIAYVAADDLKALRNNPAVAVVSEFEPMDFFLDNGINYSLGIQTGIFDRRLAVYGGNEELTPVPVAGHPENPRNSALDGYEGQNINIAVIDSGIDWRHPMFGGTGNTTPMPRVSGNAASFNDNRKVIYYYALSSPGVLTDDFGHGTLVASTAAGFAVDGNTPAVSGFGTGRDGTGIGPTLSGTRYHGTAPQARVMGYKVCGPAPQCAGNTALAMEDAASPYTLLGPPAGGGGSITPTTSAKPVADVINLSLGDTAGSATAASSRAANNAALNGTIVVASAGNSGPGLGTIGAPSAATLAISVAASLDPGSVAGGDLLEGDEIPTDPCGALVRPATCGNGSQAAGLAAEFGTVSTANTQFAPPLNFKLFPVAGGGDIRQGSVSAHYVYVDASTVPVPSSVTNRIAIVRFTGTFASGANPVAALNPAAILLISATESATAVQVINGIPTYTISLANADTLLDLLLDGSDNTAGTAPNPPNGAVSVLPIRAGQSTSLSAYNGAMASFSSRGPNDEATSNYRTVKPDVTAGGVGIDGAATPTGLPDATVGLASTTGYTTANGTSFSGPMTAGAMALVRQRVRSELGLDTNNLNDANYRLKRFDAVTVSRALIQNTATNLRNGFGVAETGISSTSVNDLGSGHINIAGALTAKAIMVSPTLLLATPSEFTLPTRNAPAVDAQGNLEVLLPTASFGNQAIVGLTTPVVRTRKVIIRDVTRGGGGGVYNLTFQNSRDADGTNFAVNFLAANGTTPITSIRVPSGGSATFFVRTAANGAAILPNTEIQWYVTAQQASTGQTLRMPFYYRATQAAVLGNTNAPVQTTPTTTPGTVDANGCFADSDGAFNVNFTYTPTGGVNPTSFRVEEATSVSPAFTDNASENLVAGANSRWSGSAQYVTVSGRYFVPNAAMQNELLTQISNTSLVGATSATLNFDIDGNTEANFDYFYVDASPNNGASWIQLASYTDTFSGAQSIDLGSFAGGTVKIRFRMFSDDNTNGTGTFIDNIAINRANFQVLTDAVPNSDPLAYAINNATGTRFYRIAGLFSSPDGVVRGPYSNVRCVVAP